MSPEGLTSVQVGFHVRATGEQGPDCGQPVTWHDSPWLSWLECTCGASSLTGNVVTYGAPVPIQPLPHLEGEQP